MCLEDGVPCKNRCGKGTREAVTGSYRICDLHLGRFQEVLLVGCKDVTAVHASSEDDRLQVVVLKQTAAWPLLAAIGFPQPHPRPLSKGRGEVKGFG